MRIKENNSIEGNLSKRDNISAQGSRVNPLSAQDRSGVKLVREDIDPQEKKTQKISREELTKTIDRIDKTVRVFNRSIHFTKHEESGRLWIKVIDTETKKVVREIPPEEILNIVARLDEIIGLLVDERR